jgi:hypothetical protein
MGRHTVNSTAPKARQIRHQLKQINPSNSHAQLQSPLFSTLPPELRNQIFELAVSQQEDNISGDEQHQDKWYNDARIGIKFRYAIHTDLLRTCRRIYYETSSIPMQSTTHRMKLETFSSEVATTWFSRLTAKNINELYHVHFFVDDVCSLILVLRLPQCQPKHLTMSIFEHYTGPSPNVLLNLAGAQQTWRAAEISMFSKDIKQYFKPAGLLSQLPNSVLSCVVEFKRCIPDRDTLEKTVQEAAQQMDEANDGSPLLRRRDGNILVQDKTSTKIRSHAAHSETNGNIVYIVTFKFVLEK